jgi:hypothetical protein
VEAYIHDAFPYERRCLRAHAELLALARGQEPGSLPEALRSASA